LIESGESDWTLNFFGGVGVGIIVFESLLPVLLVIGAGFLLRELRIIPQEQWEGIELVSYWLLFPALVLVSLINMDLSQVNLGSISKSYLLAMTTHLIFVWALRRPLKRYLEITDRTFSSIFQTSTRWNAFMAFAIANNFAGDQGLAFVALIMALTIPVFNFVNIVVLTICCSDTRPTITSTVINTLRVPIIWGALLGLWINVAQVPVYEPLKVSSDIVGRAGLGIGLLTVGAGLHFRAIAQSGVTMFVGVVAKLFVFPLLVFTCCMIFHVDGLALQIAMISSSVATAMNGYILARQMGGDADLYAATASLQVVLSMFTIPLILWMIKDFV